MEPSATMRAQRPAHRVPAIHGIAEQLPLDDQSVDASMAMITVHQWADSAKGLSELRRVTRGPSIVLTFDRDALDRFWLVDYAPELIATEEHTIAIPIDCVDGFTEAYYARPERFLDPIVWRSQSAWGFVDDAVQDRFVQTLGADLLSGAWDERYSWWRQLPAFEGSLRLIISRPMNGSR